MKSQGLGSAVVALAALILTALAAPRAFLDNGQLRWSVAATVAALSAALVVNAAALWLFKAALLRQPTRWPGVARALWLVGLTALLPLYLLTFQSAPSFILAVGCGFYTGACGPATGELLEALIGTMRVSSVPILLVCVGFVAVLSLTSSRSGSSSAKLRNRHGPFEPEL